jgi:hypothetical protein
VTEPAVPLPRIERTAHGWRFLLDGRPGLLLGGQLHNSTPTDIELPAVLDRVGRLHANVVIGSVSWTLVEPEKGGFDFTTVDAQLRAARDAGLRLVLIWFGAFKNAASTYAPSWVRADPDRFPRAVVRGGRNEAFSYAGATPKPVLSVLSPELRAADRAAFVAFLQHLAAADPQHTVVLVQVENEVGLLGDSRDRSLQADAAWSADVPSDLLEHLAAHEEELVPELAELWRAGGRRAHGSWAEVFGTDWRAEEVFMAWAFAAYAEELARAGKAVKPLPMFANAWLGPQPGQPEAGDYPSGGPTARVLDVWKAGAPSLDLLAPDVYVDDAKAGMAPYFRPDNPVLVPESRVRTGSLFWVLGALRGIGFSAFGIDDVREDSRLAQAYDVLSGMQHVIADAQAEGRIAGVLLEQGEREEVALGDLRITIQGSRALLQRLLLDAGVQAPPPDVDAPSETEGGMPERADVRAFGLVVQEGPDQLLVVGQDLTLDFAAEGVVVEVDSVEAGRFEAGTWRRTRILNGDERLSIVPHDRVGATRVRLIRLPPGPQGG